MGMEEYMQIYVEEAGQHLKTLQDLSLLAQKPDDSETIKKIFRACHTLKSSSAAMGFDRIAEIARKCETLFGRYKDSGKIDADKLLDIAKVFGAIKILVEHANESAQYDTNEFLEILKKLGVGDA